MSEKTKTTRTNGPPRSPRAEVELPGNARISPAVKELEEKGTALYKEMSSFALPRGSLATLRDMVRELDKTRLEIEILENDYQTSLNTIKSLQDVYRQRGKPATMSDEELERLKALPEHLNKAIEEREAFQQSMDKLQTEKESPLSDLNDARAQAEGATSRAANVDSELSKLQEALGTTTSENEELRSAFEQERSSRRTEAENAKALSEQNSRLSAESEQMDEDRRKFAQRASETAQVLDEMSGRLSKMEKKNADLTSAMERTKAKEDGSVRELQMANANRELAEDRARVLSEQRSKDETRIRTLKRRLNDLLVQRAEMEKEMEVTRSAMIRVEENVNALCAVKRRSRAAGGGHV
jgi:chromosome segregation ATPase